MAKNFWTVSEDRFFLKTVINIVGEKSGTLNEAFEVVSKKLGRTVPSCQARYKNTIRSEVPQAVLDIISANNPRNASLKNQDYGEDEDASTIVLNFEDEDIDVEDIEEVTVANEVLEEEGVSLKEACNNEDFSDIPSLLNELITLDARRKIVKERIKKYHEFIGGVLSNK